MSVTHQVKLKYLIVKDINLSNDTMITWPLEGCSEVWTPRSDGNDIVSNISVRIASTKDANEIVSDVEYTIPTVGIDTTSSDYINFNDITSSILEGWISDQIEQAKTNHEESFNGV
jgi:hypothetical protein